VSREVWKYALALALVVGSALAFVRLQDTKGYGLRTGDPAPLFTLPDLGGKDLSLQSQRGKLVLVNFWGTFCAPCVAEMPSLEKLHETLSGDGLVVVGVAVDESARDVEQFVKEKGIHFTILQDPGGRKAAELYRTTGYPETFIVSSSGTLLEKYVGPAEWDDPGALRHFRDLLSAARTSPTR
jgi:peroxiredoxin